MVLLLILVLLVMQDGSTQRANFNGAAGDTLGLIAAINAANDEVANPGPDISTLAGGTAIMEANSLAGPDAINLAEGQLVSVDPATGETTLINTDLPAGLFNIGEAALDVTGRRYFISNVRSPETTTFHLFVVDLDTGLATDFELIINGIVFDPFADALAAMQTCTPPIAENWVVSGSCTFAGTATAPANVIVEEDVTLTIGETAALDIDFSSFHLLIKS